MSLATKWWMTIIFAAEMGFKSEASQSVGQIGMFEGVLTRRVEALLPSLLYIHRIPSTVRCIDPICVSSIHILEGLPLVI